MPIRGDILSAKFAPEISIYDTANGSTKLKAGVTEYIRAEYEVRLFWYAEPTTFDVFLNGSEIRRNDGKSFYDDGFAVGETFAVQFGFGASPAGQNGAGTISAISEDGYTIFSNIVTLVNGSYDSTAECLITGTDNLTQAVYRFGLIENEESFNTFSKLTGDDQRYYVKDLTLGLPKFGTISGNIKGWASSIESIAITKQANSDIPINRGPDFGGTGGAPITNSVLNYTIRHQFPILPYYTVGQLSNVQNLIAPEFLAGSNSLKHVFECTFKKNISDEENNKQVRFQSIDGSVGFFDENFNGLQSQYSVTNVNYFDNASGLPNPSLLVQGVTKILVTLNSADGTFTANTRVVAVHSYLPLDEDEYLESLDYFDENFAFQATLDGGGGSIITGVNPILVDPNTLTVEIFVNVSGVKPELTAESNYLLALVVQDETLTQENSDRTTLLLDVNTYDLNPDIPDLLIVDEMVSYDHVTDDTNTGFTDYKGWIQDGYEVTGAFRLDRSKFAFLNTFNIDLVAWKDGTNDYFTIQSNEFNVSNAVIDGNGNQAIDIQQTQGFKLDPLDQFNKKILTTGSWDGTFISYNFELGLKINWQDWLSLPDADSVFVDVLQPNNGLNQNSSRYSLKEGYTLQTIIRAEVLETEQNISTDYIHKLSMVVNDFEEDSSQDWSATLTTSRDDTGVDANGKVLGSGSSTRIKITFTPNFALIPDVNDFEGIIRIVEQLPQGDKTIYELSSVRTSQANNLLIPLEGEALTKVSVVGSDVVLECRTDSTLIQDVNYTVSGRLFGPAEVILGDYNDDFSNDFFV